MAGPYALDEEFVRAVADVVRRVLRDLPPITDGEPTPLIWPSPIHDATPTTTVGTTAETEAAQTDDWDIYSADKNGKLTMCTRVAYDDGGDETLYGYYRDEYYDHHGRLTKVSGETRVTIDVPALCT